jgi:hypothetical protein
MQLDPNVKDLNMEADFSKETFLGVPLKVRTSGQGSNFKLYSEI